MLRVLNFYIDKTILRMKNFFGPTDTDALYVQIITSQTQTSLTGHDP